MKGLSVRVLGRLFLASLKACLTHRASSKAAALAFYTLFSMAPILVLVIACLFAVIYKTLPEVKLSWRDVAIGALSTAALFSLGEYAIAAYLRSGAVNTSFGAAGSLAVLLIWVYYSAQIFFLGAEFTREYALTFGSLNG